MKYKKKLTKASNKRKFKKGARVHKKNKPRTSRGGIRL